MPFNRTRRNLSLLGVAAGSGTGGRGDWELSPCVAFSSPTGALNFRFGRVTYLRARGATAAMARTPVVPEATAVGALSAQRRRTRPRSAMSASRRFETSLKRLKCANSGHSSMAWRTGQIAPLLPEDRPYERAGRATKRSSADGVGCAGSDPRRSELRTQVNAKRGSARLRPGRLSVLLALTICRDPKKRK